MCKKHKTNICEQCVKEEIKVLEDRLKELKDKLPKVLPTPYIPYNHPKCSAYCHCCCICKGFSNSMLYRCCCTCHTVGTTATYSCTTGNAYCSNVTYTNK